MQRPTTPRTANEKRGAVLVIFALVVVGLFAVMALMVDLGLATLTQRQMQTASDSAALEILRDRDHTRLNATNSGPAFTRDRRRRQYNTPFADAPFVAAVGTEVIPGQTNGAGAYIHHAAGPGGSSLPGVQRVASITAASGTAAGHQADHGTARNPVIRSSSVCIATSVVVSQ